MNVTISLDDHVEEKEVIRRYQADDWSSAKKPVQLLAALRGSHSLVTARVASELVGIGNAISDGHLVVYFPHMLVLPSLRRIDPQSGVVLERIEMPEGTGISGLESDGAGLFYCGGPSGKVRAVRR